MRLQRLSLVRWLNAIFGSSVAPAPNQPCTNPETPRPLEIAPPGPIISLPELPAALQRWHSSFRLPLTRPRNANEQRAYDAIRFNHSLTFTYFGTDGSSQRTVHPIFIFHVEGFPGGYLTAYCQLRQEIRTFHLDRMYFIAD